MAWADEYCCVACEKSFIWPWGFRNAYYLLPSGETFKLESQLGWCTQCDRPSYFEKFAGDLDNRLQTIQTLKHAALAATQSATWGVLYQWVFRRKVVKARALADAYSRLAEQEQRRSQFCASRNRPRCFSCEHEADDDTFLPYDPSKCRSCGGELKVNGDSNHFRLSSKPSYYDASGRKVGTHYIQQHPPQLDDELLAQARRQFDFEYSRLPCSPVATTE